MVKEHFIESYGVPRFTIGSGGSGGSMQQHYIAQNYPGLLDAITPGISYPDLVSIISDVTDCGLLTNYFDNTSNPANWPFSRRSKVDGYPAGATVGGTPGTTCKASWDAFAHTWVSPFNGFSSVVPLAARYDPIANPTGARGSFTDGMVNIFGIDPQTGFARTVFDNVGVQYGLKAVNSGDISVAEFLDLNEKIGGLDVDGNYIPDRSEANLQGLEIAYREGVVTSGENLTLPIIDVRDYRDNVIDIHTRIRTFMKLERLKKANGTIANEVNWLTPRGTAPGVNLAQLALLAHNEWMEKILADTLRRRVRGEGDPEQAVLGEGRVLGRERSQARGDVHAHRTERVQRPVPDQRHRPARRRGNALRQHSKCQLKPIDPADYAASFSATEMARLHAIFPQRRVRLVEAWCEGAADRRGVAPVRLTQGRSTRAGPPPCAGPARERGQPAAPPSATSAGNVRGRSPA